jgi:hypothetical protein
MNADDHDDGWDQSIWADLHPVNILHGIVFWLWCRWAGHRWLPHHHVELYKETDPSDVVTFRVCNGCDRVYVDDLVAVLDTLEADVREHVLAELGVEETE